MWPVIKAFFTDEAAFKRAIAVVVAALGGGGVHFAADLAEAFNAPKKWIAIGSALIGFGGTIAAALIAAPKPKPAVEPTPPTAPPSSGLAVLLLCGLALSGCGIKHPTWLSRAWDAVAPGATQCAKEELQVATAQAGPDLTLLLSSSGQAWPQIVSQALADLGEAGWCALHALIAKLEGDAPAAAPAQAGEPPEARPARFVSLVAGVVPIDEGERGRAILCAASEYAGNASPDVCKGLSVRALVLGRAHALRNNRQ